MKKWLLPLLVVFVALIGFGSALTPMIAEWLIPVPKVLVKKAKPEAVAQALHQWFDAAPGTHFTNTRGLSRSDEHGRVSWMAFKVDPQTVSRFIHRRGLQQKDLDAGVLSRQFSLDGLSADWWQPASLTRQTWFSGVDSGRDIGLIYNAELQQGFLVARSISQRSTTKP
ncbi:MAG: hypothetical protein ACWA5X_05860 [bacterium]